jgi:hypothetical protein
LSPFYYHGKTQETPLQTSFLYVWK